jgi:hypothetical protein
MHNMNRESQIATKHRKDVLTVFLGSLERNQKNSLQSSKEFFVYSAL